MRVDGRSEFSDHRGVAESMKETKVLFNASHDLQADALYIALSDAQVARTFELDNGTLVDVDDDNKVVGLEVIHPHRQWPLNIMIERFEIPEEVARALHEYAAKFWTPTPSFKKADRTSSGSGGLARLRPLRTQAQ